MNEILPVASVFAAGGLIQGALGFGFAIVAMALLPLFMPFKEAVVLIVVLNFLAMGVSLALTRGDFDWRSASRIVVGAIIGVPVGILLLVHTDEALLVRAFGLSLVISIALQFRAMARHDGERAAGWVECAVGFASGLLAGSVNAGGPPVVAYVYSRNWPVVQAKAVLSATFLTTATMRLPTAFLVEVDWPRLGFQLPAHLLAGLGALIAGHALTRHFRTEAWRTFVYAALALLGVKYLMFG